MAKMREAVAENALEELLTNQAAALGEVRISETKAVSKKAPATSKAVISKSIRPPARPQRKEQGSEKTRGEDGKKPADKAGSEDAVEILYAKIPAELMLAMKLHLMFGKGEEKSLAELVTKKLSFCFEKEISEVRARSAGA